jgi:hypothetical protein
MISGEISTGRVSFVIGMRRKFSAAIGNTANLRMSSITVAALTSGLNTAGYG